MPREPMAQKRERAALIEERMFDYYGEGACSLDYDDPFRLTVAVVLSAQCTDAAVNKVTPALWERFPTPADLAAASIEDIEGIIRPLGFFRAKAAKLKGLAQMSVAQYDGSVPHDIDELQRLPGVGRKTANLILGDVYHTPGVVVADTHCIRITGRLGLTDGTKDPAKVEEQLRPILPPEESNDFCHRMVLHGRAVCMARKPDCPNCTLRPWCDFYTKS